MRSTRRSAWLDVTSALRIALVGCLLGLTSCLNPKCPEDEIPTGEFELRSTDAPELLDRTMVSEGGLLTLEYRLSDGSR